MFSALRRKVASAETLLWLKWLFRAWPPPPHSCRRESGRELSFSLSFFFKICITPSVFWKWQNAISANSRCWLAYSQKIRQNKRGKTKPSAHLVRRAIRTFYPGGGGGCGRSGGGRGRGGGRFDGEGGLPASGGGSEHPGALEGDDGPGWGGHSAVVVKEPGGINGTKLSRRPTWSISRKRNDDSLWEALASQVFYFPF